MKAFEQKNSYLSRFWRIIRWASKAEKILARSGKPLIREKKEREETSKK